MYAVIELQWHQYIVQEWTEISVDKIDTDKKEIIADKVLAVFDEAGKDVKVWTPYIDKASVVCTVTVLFQKDPKITVLKFKNKNRYQRKYGFRAQKTVLTVKSIALNG